MPALLLALEVGLSLRDLIELFSQTGLSKFDVVLLYVKLRFACATHGTCASAFG